MDGRMDDMGDMGQLICLWGVIRSVGCTVPDFWG